MNFGFRLMLTVLIESISQYPNWNKTYEQTNLGSLPVELGTTAVNRGNEKGP